MSQHKKSFVIDYTKHSVVVVCKIGLCQWRELTYSRLSAWVLASEHDRMAHGGIGDAATSMRKSREYERFQKSRIGS